MGDGGFQTLMGGVIRQSRYRKTKESPADSNPTEFYIRENKGIKKKIPPEHSVGY